MRILVTGGSGFIGRSLAEAWKGRHQVDAPSHGELDVLDAPAVERFVLEKKPDVVVHTAIKGGPDVLESTLRMQASLIRVLPRVSRVVWFGSGAEFAKTRDLDRIGEESLGDAVPADPYGLAKMMLTLASRAERRLVNVRIFGCYGPLEGTLNRFISNAVAKNLLGLPIRIRQDVRFDYLWIDDLAAIAEHFLDAPAAHADFNATPDASTTLREIAAAINAVAKKPSDVSVELPGMNFSYTGSNARLRQAFPALRFTPMPEGIAKLYAWHRDRIDALDREAITRDEYARAVKTRG